MEVKWIDHGGKRILYVDFQEAKTEEDMLNAIYSEVDILKKEKDKQLLLVNIRNVFMTEKANKELRRLSKEVIGPKTTKTALVGITGVKKVIFNAIVKLSGENGRMFDTEEDAKKWLAE
jgi:hypothetical protein